MDEREKEIRKGCNGGNIGYGDDDTIHLLSIIDGLREENRRQEICINHIETLEPVMDKIEAENSVLREQNSAMEKRLSEIGRAVEPIVVCLKERDRTTIEKWKTHNNFILFFALYTQVSVGDLRNLIAAVKEGE